MEGVPRLPMLGFELKSYSDHVDFSIPLKSYIAEFYSENADLYSKECLEFNQLRKLAVSSSLDFIGCSNMKKYFCQIEFLCSRFPTTDGRSLEIQFTWEDTISQQMVSDADIKFEQANILFNIGCLHSKLGSMDNRMTPEGMKVSCTHFQCAAWMFQHLRDAFDKFKCLDFNKDLLSFMSITMLAQAQECILEKSMTDNRKSSITAKVSAQIVEHCNLAIKHLNNFTSSINSGSKITKEWKRRLELKAGFYECITLYYMGLNAEDQSKWGERLTYLQAAVSRLDDLMKNNKLDDTSVDESLKFMVDIIGGKFNSAKKDNDFIYHDKVPSLESLPEVKGASLVKGIPLNVNDPEVSGQDIFKKLVPFVVHQKSSLYSEEKAIILRKIGSDIDIKDQELRDFLSVLQLNTNDSIFPTSTKIPDLLLEKCASMSVRPNAIKDLIAAMQVLSSKSMDVEGDLNSTLELIDSVESGLQGMPKSSVVRLDGLKECEELKKECVKHGETLKATSHLNEGLHGIMETHIANLKILSCPVQDVYAAISNLHYTPSENEMEILQDMKKLMGKVDDMMKQRIQLEEKLRDQIQKDDITQILVASSDVNYEELFQEQLEKHGQQVSLINQNLAAQGNILQALTETNAKYADIKKHVTEANEKQQDLIDSMIKSYEVYEDLLSKTQQGIDLYDKLGIHISKLFRRAENLFKNHQKKDTTLEERAISGVTQDTMASTNVTSGSNVVKNAMEFNNLHDVTNISLKLKDYLPFMKPDTFGPSIAQKNSEIPKADFPHSASISLDASPNKMPSALTNLNPIKSTINFSIPTYPIVSSSAEIHRFPHTSTDHAVVQYVHDSNSIAQQHMGFAPGSSFPVIRQPEMRSDIRFIRGNQFQVGQVMSKVDVSMNQPMNMVNQQGLHETGIKNAPSCQMASFSRVPQPSIFQNVAVLLPPTSAFQQQQMQQPIQYLNQQHVPQSMQHPNQQQVPHLLQQPNQQQVQQPLQHPNQQPMQQPLQHLNQQQVPQLLQQPNQQVQQPLQHLNQLVPQSLQQPNQQQVQQPMQYLNQQQMHQPLQHLNHQQVQQPMHLTQQQTLQHIIHPLPIQTVQTTQPRVPTSTSFQNFNQVNLAISPQLHHFQQPHLQNNNQIFHHSSHPTHQQIYNSQQSAYGNQFIPSSLNKENPNLISSANNAQVHKMLPDYQNLALPQSFPLAAKVPLDQAKPALNFHCVPSVSSDCGRTIVAAIQDPTCYDVPKDQFRKKSLDEMLLNGNISGQTSSVLIPKVITDEDLKREQNEEAKKNLKLNFKDCYAEPEFLSRFVDDVEKFQNHVNEICMLSKRVLESKWKELNEAQDKSSRSSSMAVARCYPLKNRQQDIMPFDNSRVKLLGAADDYINASLIKSTSLACPDIIATQAPLPVTFADFWQMIHDYNVEVIVVLCTESEAFTKGQSYWPNDKGQKAISLGNFAVTLHSIQVRPSWTERIIGVTNSKSQVSRSVIHLNFHSWPPGAEPDNCNSLLEFINHVHDLYLQQRSLLRPIVVHCSNGVGRTGTFVAIYAAVQEMNQGSGIVDVCSIISQMRSQRKYFVEFERQLKFCYVAILQHAKNVLKNYGIQSNITESCTSQVHQSELNASKSQELPQLEVVQRESIDCATSSLPQSLPPDVEVTCEPKQYSQHMEQHPATVTTSNIFDLQNPEKFSLDCKTTKHKITKANFFNHSGLLGNKTSLVDPSDPLNELDPLWTMKK